VKLYKARHLVEMTVARQPDLLEICFAPFGNSKSVHGYKHRKLSFFIIGIKAARYQPLQLPTLTKPKVFLGTLLSHGASLFLRSIRLFIHNACLKHCRGTLPMKIDPVIDLGLWHFAIATDAFGNLTSDRFDV